MLTNRLVIIDNNSLTIIINMNTTTRVCISKFMKDYEYIYKYGFKFNIKKKRHIINSFFFIFQKYT